MQSCFSFGHFQSRAKNCRDSKTMMLLLMFLMFSIEIKQSFLRIPWCMFSWKSLPPSAVAPAPLSHFRTRCHPPVNKFAQPKSFWPWWKFCFLRFIKRNELVQEPDSQETPSLTGRKVCVKPNTASTPSYKVCVQGVFVLSLVGPQHFNAISIHTQSTDT